MIKYFVIQSIQTLRGLIVATALSGMVLALMPVQAHAQDYYLNDRSLNAGFYLRVPFGPTKKDEDRLKYGLRLNMTQQFNGGSRWENNYPLSNRQMLNADLVSLNFSEGGFRNLSLVGQKTFVYQNGMLRMNYAEGKKGGFGKTIFMVGAVAGLGLVAAAVIDTSARDRDDR
ncbi:hypothetical protein MNBD_ALPHA01-776 [hydrothermal vent metagenome]|uniref:Uncharacterized protein n=1 Tax=hydrothermal vent metagenome TaxID=652676 RepID=A0A3B0T0D3_9ZZZZ